MIKVMVVIWGLVMYVPDGTPGKPGPGLTALFVNGHHVAGYEHEATIDLYVDASGDPWPLTAPYFDITLKVSGTMQDPVPERFIAIQSWVPEGVDGRVRPECLKDDTACRVDGHRLVTGKVRFEGDWKIRPASKCKVLQHPPDFYDQATWDLRTSPDGTAHGNALSADGRLASALVLEAEVEKLSDLQVLFGTTSMPDLVKASDEAVCKGWVGKEKTGSKGCVYIEMASEPTTDPPDECDAPTPGPECRFDRHFSVFYDLLEGYDGTDPDDQDPVRWLPYLNGNYDQCYTPEFQKTLEGRPGHDPVPRCPGTYVFAGAGL